MQINKTDKKIIISFSGIAMLMLLIGSLSIIKMIELSNLTQRFYNHPLSVINATQNIQTHMISMHRYMKDIVLSEDEEELQAALNKVNEDKKIILKELLSAT